MQLRDLALFTSLNLAACSGIQTPDHPIEEPSPELQACQEYLATIQEITIERLREISPRDARIFQRDNSFHFNINPQDENNLQHCELLKAVMYSDLLLRLDRIISETTEQN